ncbi:MAG: right-handed parallel beta-helix repeat-containing protein [Acidobacteria bacterium]|nr:right-handed parallel beta-helix repeat-containing protein [Acidobacteriota bacterium]
MTRQITTRAIAAACLVAWLAGSAGMEAQPRQRQRRHPPTSATAVRPRAAATVCPRCGWAPRQAGSVRIVRGLAALRKAMREADPGATILLADGEYQLDRTIRIDVPGLVLRGASGNRDRVILRGAGMTGGRVGVGIAVNARDVTIADLTVGWVSHHGIQVRGERGAGGFVVHNVRIVDTGEQLLKGSVAANGEHADNGLVACSLFEYTDAAPSDYTNGIDVLAARGWTVRDSRFERIRGPESRGREAGPAILFWAASGGTVVERNLIVDSYRGIALGVRAGRSKRARGQETAFDHDGGLIRNNVVVNLSRWANEGIEVNSARDVTVEHNTVVVEGSLDWSISVRFPETRGTVANNLTSREIKFRNGGAAVMKGNVTGARRDWFVDPAAADLHLTGRAAGAIDAGVPVDARMTDFDRRSRSVGRAPDAGAFEYAGAAPAARGSGGPR